MNTSWMSRAACIGTDPGLWSGPDGESPQDMAAREAEAIAICRPCPVRQPCLDYHLRQPSQHGVAGGVGEQRRAALRHAWVKRQKRAEARAA